MSKQIHVGAVAVGGGAPVSIQSMCNTPTQDVERTVSQIPGHRPHPPPHPHPPGGGYPL